MLSKLFTVCNTIRHLQFIQVKYQLWYRLKRRFIRLQRYAAYQVNTLYPVPSNTHFQLIPSTGKYLGNHSFSFLNIPHNFDGVVDWNYMEHGKLWNYNLQYFDFLRDPSVSNAEKESLIHSFALSLLNGSVKPEPYPVSLRLVNWILYYSDTGYRSDLFELALKLQVDYLRNNLEFHIKANHLLENYIALVFSALALHDTALADYACKGLQEQLEEQVLPDGGHYECSPMYHSILLGKLIILVDVLENVNWYSCDRQWLKDKASKMLGWLNSFSFNDGSWAYMNDATGGIAPTTDTINTAATKTELPLHVMPLQESGYRKMKGADFEAIIDVGDIIPSYQPGHAHSDMLNFCLQHRDTAILVDTGISTYQANGQRIAERGTPAHNTVAIHGKNQSEVWGAFRVGRRANMTIHQDTSAGIIASHDGYKKNFGVLHTRSFEIGEKHLLITDHIPDSTVDIVPTAFFHFDYRAKVIVNQIEATVIVNDLVTISFTGCEQLTIDDYQQAIGFNHRVQATCIKVAFIKSLTTLIKLN